MSDYEDLRIFTETTESMGLLYNSYKDLPPAINEFLDKVAGSIKLLLRKPKDVKIDLRGDISEFKSLINRRFVSSEIDINHIKAAKKTITSFQPQLDNLLNRLAKMKNQTAFGGNYLRAIIRKPKVYSRDIDQEAYDMINNNIRNIDRALDWVEKILIDLFNMVDQDLNILTIVGRIYAKQSIYEGVLTEEYNLQNLPNKLYFATPNEIKGKTISAREPRGLFLTPYPGIASMFIIDRNKELIDYMKEILARNKKDLVKYSCNISYYEWGLDSSKLTQPLSTVHMFHNIPSFTEKKSGTSSGYIYEVDISEVKNELEEFSTRDADREVIYKGNSKLPIVGRMTHSVNWTLTYRSDPTHGKGNFQIKDMEESAMMYECGFHHGTGIDGDDLAWIEKYLMEEGLGGDEEEKDPETPKETERKKSRSKQTDEAEANKNGVRRKKLYIAFIEWAKEYNSKNTFGSLFDKDAFTSAYSFVPNEMRYFYRLANPLLCVLGGNLTFFQVTELKKLNSGNDKLNELMIFAATPNDMRVFNRRDKKVYKGVEENGKLVLKESLAKSFDEYIQKMIDKGDILNGPIEDDSQD